MRRIWTSFRARLIAGAVVWIAGGVAISGLALAELFRVHEINQFDADLHGHGEELAAVVDLDETGQPHLHRRLSDPRFLPAKSGFYWQIETSAGRRATSPSLDGRVLALDGPTPAPGVERHSFIEGPTGPLRLLQRSERLAGSGDILRIGVGIDESYLKNVLSRFNQTLFLSLSVIALGLMAAAFLQVSVGLLPLGKVRRGLAAVREGRATRLSHDAPDEVRPLIDDMNALIEANQEMVRRARTQAGNLAHGLKTPLAILVDEGERLRAAGEHQAADVILAQADRMRRQIDYQMARARAAASRNALGAATKVRSSLEPMLAAMRRLHGRRGISFELSASADLIVAVESQDFGEMVANLVDNAGKWAGSRVQVKAEDAGGKVRITVDDDGPGLPPESWDVVFDLGERLDEKAPGSGLGLAIVRDLAQLYGGRAWIETAPLGGARAVLELP